MSAPRRVRMTRQRPWRIEHPRAVIVARPGRWGNPFTIGQEYVVDYELDPAILAVSDHAAAVVAYRQWLDGTIVEDRLIHHREDVLAHLPELAGQDLACWCPLLEAAADPAPCHADVLLELANHPRQE